MNALTQDQLKSILDYDPKTGLFTWKVKKSPRASAGSVAGSAHIAGYVEIGVDDHSYLAHRLAFLWMTGVFPSDQIDHINGVRDDNRWENLRAVSDQANKQNMKRPRNNRSGVVGVSWFERTGKWRAYITVSDRQISLGYHHELADAIRIRKQAEMQYGFHGNHGRAA